MRGDVVALSRRCRGGVAAAVAPPCLAHATAAVLMLGCVCLPRPSVCLLTASRPAPLPHLARTARFTQKVRKHLDRNRRDKDSKYRLILIESRIHRLARESRRGGARVGDLGC